MNLKCESDAAIIMGYTEPEHINEQACEGVSAVRPQSRIVIDQLFVQPGVACLPAWSVMGADGQSYLRNRPRAQHVGSTSETRSNATLLEAGETLPDPCRVQRRCAPSYTRCQLYVHVYHSHHQLSEVDWTIE